MSDILFVVDLVSHIFYESSSNSEIKHWGGGGGVGLSKEMLCIHTYREVAQKSRKQHFSGVTHRLSSVFLKRQNWKRRLLSVVGA